jgi:hypothetical protein
MALFPLGILSAAGAGGVDLSSYELISTTILGSAQSSVVFDVSALASTYKHLQIRYVMRSDRAGVPYSNGALRMNADTGSNYNAHYLVGNGSTVSSGFVSSATSMLIGNQPGGTFTANAFSAGVMDILDAFSTTKFKTVRSLSGQVGNDNALSLQSGLYRSTNAATSVTVLNWDGANLAANSRFSIYGLKG